MAKTLSKLDWAADPAISQIDAVTCGQPLICKK
jgi:hypothetical protein